MDHRQDDHGSTSGWYYKLLFISLATVSLISNSYEEYLIHRNVTIHISLLPPRRVPLHKILYGLEQQV